MVGGFVPWVRFPTPLQCTAPAPPPEALLSVLECVLVTTIVFSSRRESVSLFRERLRRGRSSGKGCGAAKHRRLRCFDAARNLTSRASQPDCQAVARGGCCSRTSASLSHVGAIVLAMGDVCPPTGFTTRIDETDFASIEEEANTLVHRYRSVSLSLALARPLSLGLLPRRRDGEQFHDRMEDL